MTWEQEMEQAIELAEMAEEAALAELGAFGSWDADTALGDAEWDEASEEFWAFACDLYGEPRSYVLTELY